MKDKKLYFMEWNECKTSFLRNVEIDEERIASTLKLAMQRLAFVQPLEVTEKNASFIVEDYYEIIKELLSALLLKNGFRSQNHQCFITFFYKNYPKYEFEAYLILRMSYLRNRLNYYGESIDISFYEKHKTNFVRIINIVKELVEN